MVREGRTSRQVSRSLFLILNNTLSHLDAYFCI
jgi:hypothetical protein